VLPGSLCIDIANRVLDFQKIYGKGQYISVDGRPISTSRGTFKELVELYKTYLRPHSDTCKTTSDPFLCMNINCPSGSYDPNVEPAKDDVLFVDSKRVLTIFEELLKSIYGDVEASEFDSTSKNHSRRAESAIGNSFDLLLARRPPEETYIEERAASLVAPDNHGHAKFNRVNKPNTGTNAESAMPQTSTVSSRERDDRLSEIGEDSAENQVSGLFGHRNMYSADDEDMLLDGESSQIIVDPVDDDPSELRDIHVNNPWTIAKMNAPIRKPLQKRHVDEDNTQLLTPAREREAIEILRSSASSAPRPQVESMTSSQPSPGSSQASLLSPMSSPRETSMVPRRSWIAGSQHSANGDISKSARLMYGAGALDTWVQKSMKAMTFPRQRDSEREVPPSSTEDDSLLTKGFTQEDPIARPSRSSPINHQHRQRISLPRRCAVNRPSKSPLKQPGHSDPEHEPRPTIIQRLIRTSSTAEPIFPHAHKFTSNRDLEIAMDFEIRKKAALAQHKRSLAQEARKKASLSHDQDFDSETTYVSSTPPSTNSPHQNRYLSAKSALNNMSSPPSTQQELGPMPPPALHPHDPRSYLMRQSLHQHNSHSRLKTKRTKTSLLPLETTPADSAMHDVCTTIHVSLPAIASFVDSVGRTDEYTRGRQEPVSGSKSSVFEGVVSASKSHDPGRAGNSVVRICSIRSVEEAVDEGTDVGMALRNYFLEVGIGG
jgi:DNA mismatch repair ATPase MutL